MENKLIVSLSPHVHGGDSVQKNMYGVLIALIPAFLVSLYFFGLGALIVTATSVAACLFFEWAIGKYLLKKPTTTICDGSAIITGCWHSTYLPTCLYGSSFSAHCLLSVWERCLSADWAATLSTRHWQDVCFCCFLSRCR